MFAFYFCSLLVNGMMVQSVLRRHDKRLVYPVESDIHSTYKRTNLKRKTYEIKEKEKEWKRGRMYRGGYDLSKDRQITATLSWTPGDLKENVTEGVLSPLFQELRHRLEAFPSLQECAFSLRRCYLGFFRCTFRVSAFAHSINHNAAYLKQAFPSRTLSFFSGRVDQIHANGDGVGFLGWALVKVGNITRGVVFASKCIEPG